PSDLAVVREAQERALEQARQMLEQGEQVRDREALEAAIEQMELAQKALDEALTSPEKLPAAIAAEQAAYEALLKVTPREFRVSRSRRGQQQNSGGGAGQPNQRQLNQLEMREEENRYETERQASSPLNQQQREQLQAADRLRELAQRQQDLNERLRELQTALQAAQTQEEREELERQLNRLRDEQRQMLADVDQLRQELEQSPNASDLAEAREQLEQTRSDMQRAVEQMDRQSPSQALASGTRAQQSMQDLREELRRQTSSQFSEQMRDLRNQARELAQRQEEIARELESLNSGPQGSMDDSARRRDLADRMNQQQNALTNLLGNMREVTEQSENSEPLLSRQLYDTLRRADQMRTDNLLELGAQLTQTGLLPQASEVERAARENIADLRRSIERAAESVLGSEAEALRFAQRELEDLERQLEQELAGSRTNLTGTAAGGASAPGSTNSTGLASSRTNGVAGGGGTNDNALASGRGGMGTNSVSGSGGLGMDPDGTNTLASANDRQGRSGRGGQGRPGEQNEEERQGQQPGSGEGQGSERQQASAGQGQRPGEQREQGEQGQQGQGGRGNLQTAQNRSGQPGRGQQQDGEEPGDRQAGGGGRGDDDRERLRDFARQLGGRDNGSGWGGPITGDNYVNWSDRLRDVERVLDSDDLRNQLATVRERVGVLRREFRDRGIPPDPSQLQEQVLKPMTEVRYWLRQELARQESADSLVPLDRDPVPEAFSELVRRYYERLGSAQ
ncbi:MAG TPA: hypothetical protein PKH32_04255, partial [Verrucomicrobiota bacterium]|nr:hypothetical protein [Verrucomicrobiota bacterium]